MVDDSTFGYPRPMPPFELNEQQRRAAEHDGGHVLVLAGAGTGKTRTIIARAAHLLRRDVDAGRILLLTFTRRAASEMASRLNLSVGPAASGVVAGTFHHFCLRMMRRWPRHFGTEQATIIDRDDQNALMKLARGLVIEQRHRRQFPKAAKLVTLQSYARNTNQPLRAYLERHTDHDEATMDRMGQVFAAYRERKKQNRYLDYDDILHVFARKLHKDRRLGDRMRSLFDHILVDEMQDTNPLQWLILDGLRDPGKLFCVGDDAQSIYAFRGADFRNVHSFTDRVPDSELLLLERNYRSTQEILDLTNWLLDESSLQYGKRLEAHRGAGVMPRLVDCHDEIEESGYVATDLLERHENGAPWTDHMILTRTAFGAREVEAALVAAEIPYQFIGGTSLMAAAHVKDLLCLVRASLSHRDELAWTRYLTLWRGVGDVTAARLIDQMQAADSFDDALATLAQHPKIRETILEGPRSIRAVAGHPQGAIKTAAEVLDPIEENRLDRWDRRRKDYDLLVRLAERHRSLEAFLETYALEPVYSIGRRAAENEDAITLTTVHGAKGTEAPVCYVIRAEPGMYPHGRSLGDADAEEEERRILYVAMTRAQEELILTRANSQLGRQVFYGGFRGSPSEGGSAYFLEDLPARLVEMGDGGIDEDDPWDDDVIESWER